MDMCFIWTCVAYRHVLHIDLCCILTCVSYGHVLHIDMCFIWTCVAYGHVLQHLQNLMNYTVSRHQNDTWMSAS